ncbi:IS5 family transposase [Streptomyces sp. NPDC058326]|uniref:IS5 family transposase n=1 Tax=Streptomyces sp. NPDC058326 TaxID=3346447 RepID=UPI0036EA7780
MARIEPLLPDRTPRPGRRWRDHRQVIDAIAFKYRTGTPWMDLPTHFGSWKDRPQPAAEMGRRRHLGEGLHRPARPGRRRRRPRPGRRGRLHRRPGSPARRRGPSKGAPAGEPDDHALGRSRGGLTNRIHLAADSRCRPLAFVLTPGQTGDAPAFPEVMARLRVPRPVDRPRTTPDVVLTDKAHSSRAIRTPLRQHGIRAVIPQPSDQAANRKRRGSRGGRPPAFDRETYKRRNTVERCINKLKQRRGLATRYDKTATICLAGLHIAAIFIWSAR